MKVMYVFVITGSSNILPDTLQKVSMPIITSDACDAAMAGCIGCRAGPNHICAFDAAAGTGSCNVSYSWRIY